MINRMSPSFLGVAYCGFAVFAVAAFLGVAGYIDPTTLAMY
jgi:hypothetical protein